MLSLNHSRDFVKKLKVRNKDQNKGSIDLDFKGSRRINSQVRPGKKALLQTISWEIGLAALLSEVIKKAADKLVVHFHTGLLRQFAKPLP